MTSRNGRCAARWSARSAIATDRKAAAGQSGERSQAIEGLRGLAALSVLGFHVWLYRDERPKPRTELFDRVMFNLHLGLLCFFVLSGFLLWRSFAAAALADSGTVGTLPYARRRFARIVPAYWASIAGCLAAYAIVGVDSMIPPLRELPLFLLFLQNYSVSTLMEINPVLWTLGVEMAFYCLLPVLGTAAVMLGRGRAWRQAGLLVVLAAVTFAWNATFHAEKSNEVARKALPAYLACFAAGMMVALWVESRRRRGESPLRPVATASLFMTGVALVALGGTWKEMPGTLVDLRAPFINFVPSVGFALLVAAVSAGSGRWARAPGVLPLAAAGVISYGLYLWHVPVILVMWEMGWLPTDLAARMAVVLAASIALGWTSWRLVERPAIAWGARDARRRGATPVGRPG